MQLTNEQLDIAARKLCEDRGGSWDNKWDREVCPLLITEMMRLFNPRIAAIIHAVTKGGNDEAK